MRFEIGKSISTKKDGYYLYVKTSFDGYDGNETVEFGPLKENELSQLDEMIELCERLDEESVEDYEDVPGFCEFFFEYWPDIEGCCYFYCGYEVKYVESGVEYSVNVIK